MAINSVKLCHWNFILKIFFLSLLSNKLPYIYLYIYLYINLSIVLCSYWFIYLFIYLFIYVFIFSECYFVHKCLSRFRSNFFFTFVHFCKFLHTPLDQLHLRSLMLTSLISDMSHINRIFSNSVTLMFSVRIWELFHTLNYTIWINRKLIPIFFIRDSFILFLFSFLFLIYSF